MYNRQHQSCFKQDIPGTSVGLAQKQNSGCPLELTATLGVSNNDGLL